jgi:hypothetical protein
MKLQAWLAGGSPELVDATLNHQVIKSAGEVGRVLVTSMRAMRVVAPPVRDPNTGAELAPMITVPDHSTRLDAVKQLGDLAAATRAKGGNVNIGVAVGMPGGGNGGATKSFEQRVRELREKNGLRNDEQRLDVVDAEIIEPDDDNQDDDDGSNGDSKE